MQHAVTVGVKRVKTLNNNNYYYVESAE